MWTWSVLFGILNFLAVVFAVVGVIAIGALLHMGWQIGGALMTKFRDWRDCHRTSSSRWRW
jgi:hypothetical protein